MTPKSKKKSLVEQLSNKSRENGILLLRNRLLEKIQLRKVGFERINEITEELLKEINP